ncbi:MAG TPA: hypothetical protein PLK03_07935 [Termitinemataceae bacterium]|nr:hypothetical protein [Termitinemataceae bacterium]HPQ00781.1 hypothetical protein [Termitinemataceae bacterium]
MKVSNQEHWQILLLSFLVFLLGVPGVLYAGGQREDEALARADTLIAERRYNEAILVLTEYIKENPDRFDDAQRRLQRIVRLREEYNRLAGELLDVLVNDPTNDERKLAMIRQLESLEATPNRACREFILKTKETALFTYNRAQFEKIMAEGKRFIEEGNYFRALQRYRDGFSLYREEFYQAGYDMLLVNQVNRGLQDVDQSITQFPQVFSALTRATENFVQQATQLQNPEGVAALEQAYRTLEEALATYANLRVRLASVGVLFENLFTLLQKGDSTLGDNSFLPFAFRFIMGRKTEVGLEGMVGALDTCWSTELNRSEGALLGALERIFEGGREAERQQAFARAGNLYGAMNTLASMGMNLLSWWSPLAAFDVQYRSHGYGKSIVLGKTPRFLEYQLYGYGAAVLGKLQEYRSQSTTLYTEGQGLFLSGQESQPGTSPSPASKEGGSPVDGRLLQRLVSLRNAVHTTYGEIQAMQEGFPRSVRAVFPPASPFSTTERSQVLIEYVGEQLNRALQDVFQQELELAGYRYQGENILLGKTFQDRSDRFTEAQALIEGKSQRLPSGGEYLAKYPAEALPLLTELQKGLEKDLTQAQGVLTLYTQEAPLFLTSPLVQGEQRRSTALVQQFQSLLNQVRQAIAKAREQVQLAESLKLEGDRRFREAQAALTQQNFELARTRLQQASERYDASLALQESLALRTERDNRLLSLSQEISKRENELVVRDVRRLITTGKNEYFAGNFERAENTLLQAQSRWRTTNVEDEPEVQFWLTLVRGTLSLKTGRTIPPTAPLYPEMSQLLSIAKNAFEEGKTLLRQGKRTEAQEKFNLAKQKIQEVRLLFPLNQEASLLDLQIDQILDPQAFAANFRQRLTMAQAKLTTAPQEAYSELQDLYTINPQYPGLKSIIERVEIQLGIRLPPPDPASLARARELIQAARRIIDSNVRSQFPVALEQLNEALKLNPNSEEAITLKDRIQAEVGGQAVVVLSSAAEREYQRAVQELQNGNTIVALSIVQQLLQDPKNRNVPKLRELERRIQARL